MAKSAKKLKSMTLKEFEKAAEQFDNDDPSVYNLIIRIYLQNWKKRSLRMFWMPVVGPVR